MRRSSARGCWKIFWPWRRWHESRKATRGADFARGRVMQALGQELADVHDLRPQRRGRLGVGRIVGEEMVILLERGAAAAGIVDNGVVVAAPERVDIPAGERAGEVRVARVEAGGATAGLGGREMDFVAVALQHANGGGVDAGEEGVLDAAGEEGHPAAPHPLRRSRPAHVGVVQAEAREHALHGAHGRRQEGKAAGQGIQSQALIERQAARQGAQTAAVRQQFPQPGPLGCALGGGRGLPLGDDGARRLQQETVLHAGRTGRLTGETAEAEVDVFLESAVGDALWVQAVRRRPRA